jgi:hypothetical protein
MTCRAASSLSHAVIVYSKQALQLETVKLARQLFRRDVIEPSEAAVDGLPRLWALCSTYLSCVTQAGPEGEFWVTVANEYDTPGAVRSVTLSMPP